MGRAGKIGLKRDRMMMWNGLIWFRIEAIGGLL
jgi:hypothetical protein